MAALWEEAKRDDLTLVLSKIASAELVGCDAFITNDKSLRDVNLPNVIIRDDVIREAL